MTRAVEKDVVNWLLGEDQPAIRYLALTQLLDRPRGDPEVKEARGAVTERGWAADILRDQLPSGAWVSDENLYRPKYLGTNWMLLVLGDLGLTRDEPRIRRACELWIQRFAKPDGGFGTDGMKKGELCLVGNTARALVQFGYADHPKVRAAFDWLVREQKDNGGWHCWGRNGVLDAWEGLSAFAALPRRKWTAEMKRSIERGAEFFLERRLFRQGSHYGPWFRFHYPVHYYYDLLVGLDVLTSLGYGDDGRLGYALGLLKQRRRPDGRWVLDAVHPDLEGPSAKWYQKKPPTPFALEAVNRPSKMITLRALRVLKRAGATDVVG